MLVWMILTAVGIVALIGLLICLWKWEPSDPRTDEERFAGINDLYTAGRRGLNRSQLGSDVGFRPGDGENDQAKIDETRRYLGWTEEEIDRG